MFPQRAAGVTLVELLVVVVIIGIVAAFAAPRFLDDRTFLQRGYYEELIAGLKYAQRLAGAAPMGVSVSPGVTLTFDALGRTDLAADQSINVGPFALTVLSESGRLIYARELY